MFRKIPKPTNKIVLVQTCLEQNHRQSSLFFIALLLFMTGYIKIPETGECVLSRKSHFSEPTQISGAAKNIILRKVHRRRHRKQKSGSKI